jgi:3-oxoadipate CoA-transferase beta subunit
VTGLRCVSRVYTHHAVFDIDRDAGTVHVRETYGISMTDLAARIPIELG